MSYKINIEDSTVEVEIEKRRPLLRLRIGDREHTIHESKCPSTGEFEFVVDGRLYSGWRYATAEEVYMRIAGRTHVTSVPKDLGAEGGGGPSADEIRSDVPGTVVSLYCAEGDEVKSGQQLITIESMKLQIVLIAPRDGAIETIHFDTNATFDRGATLVSLVPLEADE
jgi:biotin carboxyl carrier protein